MNDVKKIIEKLGLEPHPEGGYYKQTYKSQGSISSNCLPENFDGTRTYSTCIYFMLTSSSFSAFHRIQQDEIWHFYDGSPIRLHVISPEGKYQETIIGRDVLSGQHPQVVVPTGHWFAAEIPAKNAYALVGCTVSPGFEFEDFELANQESLIALFPVYVDLIRRLTRL